MAYLSSAAGSKVDPSREQAEAWYDLLGDLPADVLMAAARQAMVEHEYPTLPPVGMIRRLAVELIRPATSAVDAWNDVLSAVRIYGIDRRRKGLATLPPDVARVADSLWEIICDCPDASLTFVQKQFTEAYQAVSAQAERQALMPPAVRSLAEGLAAALPSVEARADG